MLSSCRTCPASDVSFGAAARLPATSRAPSATAKMLRLISLFIVLTSTCLPTYTYAAEWKMVSCIKRAISRLLKKGPMGPLPHGRGSETCCKHRGKCESCERLRAFLGLFQQPIRHVQCAQDRWRARRVVGGWSANGRRMVGEWSASGRQVVRRWWAGGQSVVSRWSAGGWRAKRRGGGRAWCGLSLEIALRLAGNLRDGELACDLQSTLQRGDVAGCGEPLGERTRSRLLADPEDDLEALELLSPHFGRQGPAAEFDLPSAARRQAGPSRPAR